MSAPNETNGAAAFPVIENPNSKIQNLPLGAFLRSPFNRSIDIKSPAFQEFVETIRQHGVIQPAVARPLPEALVMDPEGKSNLPRYELVAGERRWLGSQAAGRATMPTIVRALTDRQAIELQTVENEDREDLNPIQKAEKYQQLLDQYKKDGLTAEKAMAELCGKLGKKTSTVYEALRLLELSDEIKAAVASGTLPPSQAGLVAKIENDPHIRQRTVNRVRNYVLGGAEEGDPPSYRETVKFIDRATGRTPKLRKGQPDPAAKFHAEAEELYPCLCNHCKRAFQMLARGEVPRAIRASGKRK